MPLFHKFCKGINISQFPPHTFFPVYESFTVSCVNMTLSFLFFSSSPLGGHMFPCYGQKVFLLNYNCYFVTNELSSSLQHNILHSFCCVLVLWNLYSHCFLFSCDVIEKRREISCAYFCFCSNTKCFCLLHIFRCEQFVNQVNNFTNLKGNFR